MVRLICWQLPPFPVNQGESFGYKYLDCCQIISRFLLTRVKHLDINIWIVVKSSPPNASPLHPTPHSLLPTLLIK